MAASPETPRRKCGLCRRLVEKTTRHHLVPRSRSKKRKRRGQLERGSADGATDRVKGVERPGANSTIDLCHACHAMIHAVFTEKELETSYHSHEALMAHPEVARFVEWVVKQKSERRIAVRWTRSRRDR